MQNHPLSALSPLDGRYASKLDALRPILSEMGYMQRRVQVEICWFLALCQAPWAGQEALDEATKNGLIRLWRDFDAEDAQAIKTIEQTTNHDVKAVEYWLKHQLARWPQLRGREEWVHLACTSEDINNTSHALQLHDAREQVLLPALNAVVQQLQHLATVHAGVPMLSRTHGQAATPSTVGKEMANFAVRLESASRRITALPLPAKMNGATGNYNAHLAAWPEVDWPAFSRRVVEAPRPLGLGLQFQPYSTQIEPHDDLAALFDAIARACTIGIDLARDCWGYISLGYFRQKIKAGEIGSSTMPHKVNPIDFENAEGNFGLAIALLRHLAEKLPISRFQRDLSDSTVLRNMGVGLGHAVLALDSLRRGLDKLQLNPATLQADLETEWEVLAEPIQTVMRRYGIAGAYEKLKALTRGQQVSREALHGLIESLDIPPEARARLLELTPTSYLGAAEELAQQAGQPDS